MSLHGDTSRGTSVTSGQPCIIGINMKVCYSYTCINLNNIATIIHPSIAGVQLNACSEVQSYNTLGKGDNLCRCSITHLQFGNGEHSGGPQELVILTHITVRPFPFGSQGMLLNLL